MCMAFFIKNQAANYINANSYDLNNVLTAAKMVYFSCVALEKKCNSKEGSPCECFSSSDKGVRHSLYLRANRAKTESDKIIFTFLRDYNYRENSISNVFDDLYEYMYGSAIRNLIQESNFPVTPATQFRVGF